MQKAEAALKRMRKSLTRWLALRSKNDAVSATEYARLDRGQYEPVLAAQLRELLRKLYPDANLPYDAVSLARIVTGQAAINMNSPSPQGILPILIIAGAAVLILSQAITSYADYAEERERIRCVESGACTDSGFWLKWGAIGIGAYLVWTRTDGLKTIFRRKTTTGG